MSKLSVAQIEEWGLSPASLPRHVAIIMDGNGRWASERGLPRSLGHRAGTNRLREIIRLSSDLGIGILTLYAFSTENWKRPQDEVGFLFSLLVEYFTSEIDELHENYVRIRTLGDLAHMPEKVRAAVEQAQRRTAENGGLTLNIALNYGSRAELINAARLAARESAGEPERFDAAFERNLYTADLPDPDLLIRTGGEKRLSNFLLYQAAYAELYFTDDYWPDFTQLRLVEALREYARRKRRFGGLEQTV